MEYIHRYESPLGSITIASDGAAITGLWFEGQRYYADTLNPDHEEKALPVFAQTDRWLDIYFSGKAPDFTPPIQMKATSFRKAVWEIMLTIPFGQTMTYGEIAERIAKQSGSRTSARAVGGAVGHNAISLIIPCHRVVGSNGSLTGYAGGIDKKMKLLALEQADLSGIFALQKGAVHRQEIHKARPEEYDKIRYFYYSLIDALKGTKYHPKWEKDIYPAPEELRAVVEAGELYYLVADGRIAAAMAVNQKCNDEYKDVQWPVKLAQDEFMVIHMLGVHGDFAGRGLAKEMVRFAIEYAKKTGMKAVRLDVLKGNVPAEKLYEGIGFEHVDTVKLFYEDTGRVDFKMYELTLEEP